MYPDAGRAAGSCQPRPGPGHEPSISTSTSTNIAPRPAPAPARALSTSSSTHPVRSRLARAPSRREATDPAEAVETLALCSCARTLLRTYCTETGGPAEGALSRTRGSPVMEGAEDAEGAEARPREPGRQGVRGGPWEARPMSTAATSTACDVTAVCATTVADWTGAGGELAFASSSRYAVVSRRNSDGVCPRVCWTRVRSVWDLLWGQGTCLLTAGALVREPAGKAFDGGQRARGTDERWVRMYMYGQDAAQLHP
ncbi:hypothetical protein G7Z17_g13602 [Cylindrodendrum hubeiense]|uniref:Uncharacterized protein n=1 Tax=Cylindrodendrum hubeiense TaxID=595255 RepID=A0A9P5GYL8_9HYPO|nr:hypothetical protein G7Z17_g13602 [Cylindrodendrum hubeiense]